MHLVEGWSQENGSEAIACFAKGFEVTSIDVTGDVITIASVSTQAHSTCPLCASQASRVHSHYTRTVTDLPCVPLALSVALVVGYL